MKIIFKVAQAELRYLFYSPIAWFVIIAFYFFVAIAFLGGLSHFAVNQEFMLDQQPDWFGYDGGISSALLGVAIGVILKNIYLFIPLLTMGMINREINDGSIKLLYSSPIRSRDIAVGKFFGIVIFNAFVITIVALMLTIGYFTIQHPEYKWFLSVLLGIFLLINSLAAIGLFLSALTRYQIVAAIFTLATLFVLAEVSNWGQQYDIIRDTTYFLSINDKAETMMRGLITSRDVLYFLLIMTLFVGCTIIKMKSTQESKRWTVAFYRYSILLVVVLILGYFSSRPGKVAYLDVTEHKVNTIHPATQQALNGLDGSTVTVTLYTNLLGENVRMGLPRDRNKYIWELWEQYRRFYPQLEFKYEYFYDLNPEDSLPYKKNPGKTLEEIVAIEAEVLGLKPSMFKLPEEIRAQIDLSKEAPNLVMELEYKGKKELLRTYPNSWPSQQNVSATIKRLTRSSDPAISFVTGHYERNPFFYKERDFGFILNNKSNPASLVNNGVDTDTLSILHHAIPDDLDVLVIADPKVPYTPLEMERIVAYLDKGGNAIILSEPGKQFILQNVADKFGITLDPGTIVIPNDQEMPHIFTSALSPAGNALANEPPLEYASKYGLGGGYVQHVGALNLSYRSSDEFIAEPVIGFIGNDNVWLENGHLVVDSAAPVFSTKEGDVRKDLYVTVAKLTRQINNKQQRILIGGDADFMSQLRSSNTNIGLAFYSWALNNEYPNYANMPPPKDRFLIIDFKDSRKLLIVFLIIVPLIITITAVVLLVRRKRK